MAENVGYATLQIIPSMRGFKQKLQQGVGRDIDEVGKDSGQRFGRGFEQAVTPHVHESADTLRTGMSGATTDAAGDVARFGVDAGGVFARLSTTAGNAGAKIGSLGPIGGVALGGVLVAASAASFAIVGLASAAIGAAAGIGAAIGGIAIGAKIAAQTKVGKQALNDFKRSAVATLTAAAAPLTGVFVSSLHRLGALVDGLSPSFSRLFSALAPVVSAFVGDLIPAISILVPSLERLAEAGATFITGFGATMPGIAVALAAAFDRLAPVLATTARALGEELGGQLRTLLPLILTLAQEYLPLLPGAIHAILIPLHRFLSLAALFGLTFQPIIALTTRFGSTMAGLRVILLQTLLSLQKFLAQIPGLGAGIDTTATKTALMSAKMGYASAVAGRLSGTSSILSSNLAVQSAMSLRTAHATRTLHDAVVGALRGEIAYKRQVHLTSVELRKGAASLNLNTKEGRQNAAAVLDQIDAARQQIATYQKQGRSTAFVANRTSHFTRELLAEAHQAGFTNRQIFNLIASSNNIPRSIRQRIRSNAGSAREAIAALISKIHDIPRYKEVEIGVYVNQHGGVRIVNDYADRGASGITAFASGGRPPVGRPSIVGEEGPELFVPDGPGTIVPHDQLASVAAGRGAITINVYGAASPRDTSRAVVNALHDIDTLHGVK